MRIRPAAPEDFPEIGRIFDASATWLTERYRPDQVSAPPPGHADRTTFYRHLHDTGAVLVAEDPDPIGFSGAVVRDGVWFLSQLWVLPERHGHGVGSALLDETVAWGRGSRTFSVIASPSPAAQLLYLRASMHPLWAQVDLVGEVRPRAAPERADALTPEDQGWVDELDVAIRGTRRPEDHAFWRDAARGLALRRDGSPVGYVYVWSEGKIGPAAAEHPRDMPALLDAAMQALPAGSHVTVAVPSTNWVMLRELVGRGFAPVGSNTFMASRPLGDATRYISSGGGLG